MSHDDPKVVLDFCKVIHHDLSCIEGWGGRQMVLMGEMAGLRCCTRIFKPHIIPKISDIITWVATGGTSALPRYPRRRHS